MNQTCKVKIRYPKILSLRHITSLIKSVNGVNIQDINVMSAGREVVGELILESADIFKFKSVIELIRSGDDIVVDMYDY